MTKVLLICPGGLDHHGGMGRQMGYLVDAWAAVPEAPETVIIDPRGPGHVLWSPFYLGAALIRIAWHVATQPIWLVHVNVSERASVVRKAVVVAFVRLLRRPLVLHLHAGRFIEFFDKLPSFFQAGVRAIFANASCTIVLGQQWRHFLADELSLPIDRIELLYNAVPQPTRRRTPADQGTCRLLFLGKLSEDKGLNELLTALASHELRDRGWSLVLAGAGPLAVWTARARALGLAARTEFVGWVSRERVAELLANSDILILPSHFEGLPLAVVEALGAQVAVIATAVGAVPEFLTDGQSALLVQPGDAKALAAAILRLVDDTAFRDGLAAKGAAVFDEHFAIDRYARRMLEIYERHCGLPVARSS